MPEVIEQPRFTPHTNAGYWWVRDNLTGEAVTNSIGRRLFYHINSLGAERAAGRAKRKATSLNQKCN